MEATVKPRHLVWAGITAAAVVATALGATMLGTARATTPTTLTPMTSTTSAPTPGITVTGSSTVTGTPDTLRLDMAVVVTRPTVNEALATANATTAKVHATLQEQGVAKADLQTTGLNINPDYDYGQNRRTVRGYTVSESMSATLRDIGRVGAVITAATAAGGDATTVNSISLDLDDNAKLLTDARSRAVADAKAKAEQYAAAAGRPLGQVISVSEVIATPSPPIAYDTRSMAGAEAAMPVPIQPGSKDVTVNVTVVYAFG